jgi:NADH:ubiquinone oxidoreductase subunit 6 (subunit J)
MFFVAGIGALAGAIGVVMLRDPFYSVLALVGHLIFLAVLFLLLRAQFIAAAQVVVYAGAVMVLYVFVVAYIGGSDQPLRPPEGGAIGAFGPLFAGVLLLELCFAILGSSLAALDSRGAHVGAGFGAPGQIGQLLLTKFLFPFEAASYLLLIAAVGAVVLARRRRGLEGPEAEATTAEPVAAGAPTARRSP